MRVTCREIVETVKFDSFKEMFEFLIKDCGLVFCDGADGSDLRVIYTFPDKNRCRNIYIQFPTDTDEETSYRKMAEKIKADLSNVDEERLAEEYDLETFRGEKRTITKEN